MKVQALSSSEPPPEYSQDQMCLKKKLAVLKLGCFFVCLLYFNFFTFYIYASYNNFSENTCLFGYDL